MISCSRNKFYSTINTCLLDLRETECFKIMGLLLLLEVNVAQTKGNVEGERLKI